MNAPAVATVFADDLTGASEIAGIAHRRGYRATVSLAPGAASADTDVLVGDTETRLLSPSRATAALVPWLQHHGASGRPGRIFKKTDSVLRGPIGAELVALARHTEARRILLVPANPGLGRIVRAGRYYIDDLPLDQTAFKFDPHHPARTSDTAALVGPVPGFPTHNLAPADPLPPDGLIIGDASTPADLALWATRLSADTLPAGSAAFFDALLGSPAGPGSGPPYPDFTALPFLLLSGTTVPAQRTFLASARDRGLPTVAIPTRTESAPGLRRAQLREELQLHGRACAYPHGPVDPKPEAATFIRRTLATIARENVTGGLARHLIIEGGATAADIAASLDWTSFRVIHEWSPGIVTVAPDLRPDLRLTLKPGSYPWPAPLLSLIFAPGSGRTKPSNC